MSVIKKILLTIWQLPQCLIAWIMFIFCPETHKMYYNDIYYRYSTGMRGGISLGRYVIFTDKWWKYGVDDDVKHEYGHTRQSLFLGPLYLIIIGIPSILWAAFYNGDTYGYYTKFYTERWADKLGGVVREKRTTDVLSSTEDEDGKANARL